MPDPVSLFPDDPPAASPYDLNLRNGDVSLFPADPSDTLTRSVRQGVLSTPDRAARVLRAQQRTGLPTALLEENLEDVEREAAVRGFDAASFRASSPIVARWLASNVHHAGVAQDDLIPLTTLERVLAKGSNAWGALANGLSGVWASGLGLAQAGMEEFARGPIGRITGTGPGVNDRTHVVRQMRQRAEERIAERQAARGDVGFVEGGLYGAIESAPTVAASVAGSILTANPVTGLAIVGASSGGRSYGQARDAGKDVSESLRFGAVDAAIEVLTEKIPAERLLKDVVGHETLLRTVRRQMVSDGAGEQFATVLQDLNQWATIDANRGKTFQDYLEERPSAAAETFVASTVLAGGTSLLARTIERGTRGTPGAQNLLEELGAASAASKTRERAPEAFKALVADASANGPIQAVHLPVETFTTYFQEQGEDPVAVAARLTGSQTAYARALESGGDLRVPLSSYLTDIAGTAHGAFFAREARFDPLMPNGREQGALETELAELAKPGTSEPNGNPIAAVLEAQLAGAGFDPRAGAALGQLYEAVFSTVGQRAGLDPTALFERYGLQVRTATKPAAERAVPAPVEALFQEYLTDARTQDAAVDELQLRQEFNARLNFLESVDAERQQGDERALLEAIAAAGGLSVQAEEGGGYSGELRWLREGALGPFGSFAGVRGVFRVKGRDSTGNIVQGRPIDGILEALQADGRFPQIHDANDVLTALESIARRGDVDGPGLSAERLAVETGMRLGTPWWRDAWRTTELEFFQPAKRGSITFGPDRQTTITLFKAKNRSTFLHESGHLYLEVFGDVVDALAARDPGTLTDTQRRVLADYGAILQWLGVENRRDIGRAQHEQWARGFEDYLMRGHAPSLELRSIFARFRSWLVRIYRNVSGAVELSDDVRAVMDRLVATDEAIALAQDQLHADPLFPTAAAAGMTDDEFAGYQRSIQAASDAARDELQQKLFAQLLREREAWWQQERATVRAEVAGEFHEQPVYKALALLQRGTQPDGSPLPPGVEPFTLSRASLVEQFGDDILKRLPKPYVYRKSGGVPASVAAELLGFPSGRALVNALATARPMNDAIDAETDARMRARHGDMLVDGTIEEQARQAVSGSASAAVFEAELKALAARVPGRTNVPPLAAIRAIAQRRIATLTVGELEPAIYAAAARRASQQALEATARDDFATALRAKHRQLLNAEIYRAATAAQDAIDAAFEAFRPILSGTEATLAKTRNMDMVAAARALLVQFKVGHPRDGDQAALVYLEQIRKYDPETHADLEAAIDAAAQPSKPYRELTTEEFGTLRDAVLNLWHVSRRERVMQLEGQAVEIADARAQLEMRLHQVATPKARAGYKRKVSAWDETKLYLLGARASLRRVEHWVDAIDGGDAGGVFRRILFQPVSQAADRYRAARNEKLERYLSLVRQVERSLTPLDITAPELDYTFSGKAELLHALLHTGNHSNLSKLLRGRGWGEERLDGTLDTSRWDAFVAKQWRNGTLTRADYEYVQGVWDLLEDLKPDAQRVHHDLYGFYFAEITAQAIVTPFGTFRGGYMPAIVDPFIDSDAAARDDRATLESSPNSFMFPSTGRGFTKSRVEPYARPLSLNLRLVPSHIDKVLRFIHLQPVVKDAGRLVLNKGFRKSLDAFDPAVAGDMLVPWLQRAARQTVDTSPATGWGGKGADRFFRALRRRTGLQVMTGNVINALQQITGVFPAALKVPAPALTRALWRYVRAPKQVAASIAEASTFMRTRTTASTVEVQAQIDDLLLNPSKYERVKMFAQKHAYFLQVAMQNIVDVVTWGGAYDHAIAGGATQAAAVAQADAAVRLTQGSFNAEDLSRYETGSPFMRAFTMFFSYWNTQANLLGTEFTVATRELGLKKGAGRLLYIYAFGFMAPAVIAELITRAGRGDQWDEDDDGEVLDDLLGVFFGSQQRAATAMVPGVGMAINSGLNAWNDRRWDDRISASPAITAVEAAVRAPSEVYEAVVNDGRRKDAIRDTLTAVGLLTGLPAAPLGRPLGYLSDVSQAEVDPAGPVDAVRGAIVGR